MKCYLRTPMDSLSKGPLRQNALKLWVSRHARTYAVRYFQKYREKYKQGAILRRLVQAQKQSEQHATLSTDVSGVPATSFNVRES